jgi:hypothetical protein
MKNTFQVSRRKRRIIRRTGSHQLYSLALQELEPRVLLRNYLNTRSRADGCEAGCLLKGARDGGTQEGGQGTRYDLAMPG